jgi:hypothetical protein
MQKSVSVSYPGEMKRSKKNISKGAGSVSCRRFGIHYYTRNSTV